MYKRSTSSTSKRGSYKPRTGRGNYRGRTQKEVGPRKNHQIRVSEVLLIDENNENVGLTPIQVAQSKANDAGLDLVEVSPEATPPVCKIMDYSKYLYEQKKKLKANKKKSKQKEMKEFRFTPVIDVGDINFRVRRALDYLKKGHNVRITMFRKGRQSRELAKEKLEEILTYFDDYSTIETEISREGRRSFITFKPDGKAKN